MGFGNKNKRYVKDAKKRANRRKTKIFAARQKGKFKSFISQFAGILFILIGGGVFAVFCVDAVFHGTALRADAVVALFILVVGCVIYYKGRKVQKLLGRFRFYRTFLEGREYITLAELSHLTGRKIGFLQDDLKRMIDRKLFLRGRLDKQETCLILTDEAYDAYLNMEVSKAEKEADFVNASVEPEKVDENTEDVSEKAKGYRELAEEYLGYYEEIQKKFENKSVQRIVTELGVYTVRILAYDIEKDDREQFLMYYLPVTKKLLETYQEMEKEKIADNASDVEDILNTVRYSFETFAEKLSEGEGMDVETDILALDTMLSRI